MSTSTVDLVKFARAGDEDRTRIASLEVRPSRLTVDVGGQAWLVSTHVPMKADTGWADVPSMCHGTTQSAAVARASARIVTRWLRWKPQIQG